MIAKSDRKRRRALQAYDRMQRAAARSAQAVECAIAAHGLSTSQFGVLSLLAENGPAHQQELADALGRSKAQITAIIDILEHRALVQRVRRATDKRFYSVHLTDSGREVYNRAAPDREAAIVDLMAELSGRNRMRLARLCRRLLRTLDSTTKSADRNSVDVSSSVQT